MGGHGIGLACSTAFLVLGGLVGQAAAESYLVNPKRGEIIDVLKRGDDGAGAEQGLRRKGATRGLKVGVATPDSPPERRQERERQPSVSFPVHFEFGSAELTAEARRVLDEVGAALTSNDLRPYRFRIVGHTDAVGSDEYNLDLSRRRAAAVEQYLSEKFGIEPARVRTLGLGEAQLLDPQNPYSGVNRRVEIVREGRIGG